jgi:heme A synthase
MVWGNQISSVQSGGVCPDWGLCAGSPSFLIQKSLFFILAALIGCVIYFLKSKKLSLILGGFFILQAVLSTASGTLNHPLFLSVIQMITGVFLFSLLILSTQVLEGKNFVLKKPSPKIQRLSVAGLLALLIQLILGALVRHTHSGLACPNFPSCLDSFFPIPLTFETGIHFAHRWWGVLLLGVFAHLPLAARKQSPELYRSARNVFLLAVAQILAGIGILHSKMLPEPRTVHAALGYALWGILFYLAIRSGKFGGLWSTSSSRRA